MKIIFALLITLLFASCSSQPGEPNIHSPKPKNITDQEDSSWKTTRSQIEPDSVVNSKDSIAR